MTYDWMKYIMDDSHWTNILRFLLGEKIHPSDIGNRDIIMDEDEQRIEAARARNLAYLRRCEHAHEANRCLGALI
jgi:hypothetical protein